MLATPVPIVPAAPDEQPLTTAYRLSYSVFTTLAFLPPDEVDRYFRAAGLRPFTPNTIVDVETLHAELEKVRQMGYALDREEHEPQVVCVAAPILNHSGIVLAAISVSGPAQRTVSAISAGDVCERVTNAARDIGARVRGADSV